MKVLTRYLLLAHIGPLLFAFVALTGVILINTLAKELANLAGKGLPLGVVFEFFVLSLPANIALTLPMAVLVAVLYTFSTLAAENEIAALRASGVDLRRAALPLVAVAALVAGGMIWFNDRVLPTANYRWRTLMTDVAQTRPLLALREQTINPIRTGGGSTPYYLEAQEIDPESGFMRRVSIYDVSKDGISRTIQADSGRMAFNPARTDLLLTLFDGDVLEVDFGELSSFRLFAFQKQVMRMQDVSERLERTDEAGYRTDRDMTVAMMRTRIGTLREELRQLRVGLPTDPLDAARGDPAPAAEQPPPPLTQGLGAEPAGDALEASTAAMMVAVVERGAAGSRTADDGAMLRLVQDPPAEAAPAAPPPAPVATPPSQEAIGSVGAPAYAEARARTVEYQIREFQVEIQKKFSIAVATLVFVLLGIPLALRFPRGGIGMVIAASLAIFGIYYVGLIGGETLGDQGYVPPIVAMWTPNVVFGLLGLLGFLRLGYEQGSGRSSGWGELPAWLRRGRDRPAGEAGGVGP